MCKRVSIIGFVFPFALLVFGILLSGANPPFAQEQMPLRPTSPPPVQAGQPVSQPSPAQPKEGLPPSPVSPPPATQQQAATQASSPPSAQPAVKRDISFSFDDADVFEVVNTVFGDILKANYMIDPKVKGRVNLRTITPVSKEEVLPLLKNILKFNGAELVEENGTYKIISIGEPPVATAKDTAPDIFVYPMQNRKATHIASVLQSILTGSSQASTASYKPPSPVTGPPAGPQTAPPSTMFSPGTGTPKSGPLVSPDTKVLADDTLNALIILATASDYGFIEKTIKKIDTIPRQVMIEAVVASITLTDNLRFGLQWSLDTDLKITGIKPFKHDVKLGGPLEFNAPITGPTFTFTAKDASGKVRLLLQSLAEENKAKVLSSPHILVSDNREARIQVGEQIPIATSQTTNISTTPAQTTTTIQYKDTGTILKVKPQVNDGGLISLELTQEVSTVSTQKVLGTEQFVISKREVTTNLVAQDGQAVVIGGLISENASKGRSGIPLLSKIPILGYLFGSTVDDVTRTELIILLTPHVVRNQEEAVHVTSEYLERLKSAGSEIKAEEFIKGKGKKGQDAADSEGRELP